MKYQQLKGGRRIYIPQVPAETAQLKEMILWQLKLKQVRWHCGWVYSDLLRLPYYVRTLEVAYQGRGFFSVEAALVLPTWIGSCPYLGEQDGSGLVIRDAFRVRLEESFNHTSLLCKFPAGDPRRESFGPIVISRRLPEDLRIEAALVLVTPTYEVLMGFREREWEFPLRWDGGRALFENCSTEDKEVWTPFNEEALYSGVGLRNTPSTPIIGEVDWEGRLGDGDVN